MAWLPYEIYKRPQLISYFRYLFNFQQWKSDQSFLEQSYDKLIKMTRNKVGVLMLVGAL